MNMMGFVSNNIIITSLYVLSSSLIFSFLSLRAMLLVLVLLLIKKFDGSISITFAVFSLHINIIQHYWYLRMKPIYLYNIYIIYIIYTHIP